MTPSCPIRPRPNSALSAALVVSWRDQRNRRRDRRQQRHRRGHRPAARARGVRRHRGRPSRRPARRRWRPRPGVRAVVLDVTDEASVQALADAIETCQRAGQQRRRRLRPGAGRGGRRRRLAADVGRQRDGHDAGDPGAAAQARGQRRRRDREPHLDRRARRLRGRRRLHRRQARRARRCRRRSGSSCSASRSGSSRSPRAWWQTEEFSLNRLGGDQAKAAAVYAGVPGPLSADDVADCIAWAVTRPWNVNVDLLVVRAAGPGRASTGSTGRTRHDHAGVRRADRGGPG